MKDKKKGIGFSYAIQGIIAVYHSEKNFRFHVFATFLVLIISVLFKLEPLEWAAIIIVIGMVLVSELVNTVIEKLIDYVKPEIHPNARFIKDASAGSVLISSLIAILVGLIIFLPKILSFF